MVLHLWGSLRCYAATLWRTLLFGKIWGSVADIAAKDDLRTRASGVVRNGREGFCRRDCRLESSMYWALLRKLPCLCFCRCASSDGNSILASYVILLHCIMHQQYSKRWFMHYVGIGIGRSPTAEWPSLWYTRSPEDLRNVSCSGIDFSLSLLLVIGIKWHHSSLNELPREQHLILLAAGELSTIFAIIHRTGSFSKFLF